LKEGLPDPVHEGRGGDSPLFGVPFPRPIRKLKKKKEHLPSLPQSQLEEGAEEEKRERILPT